MVNPNLAPLKSDPRFKEIFAKSRARFDELLAVVTRARARGELPKYLEQPLDDLLKRLGVAKPDGP